MSVAAEKFAWRKRKLNPSLKYVLLAIAHHYDARTGQCSPSMRDLCDDTCMSISTVRRNIEGLVVANVISILNVGHGRRFQYTLISFNPNESKRVNKPSKQAKEKAQIDPEKPETAGELWNKMFDTMWQIYPRKVSKANAQRAFSKMIPSQSTHALICANIKDRMLGEWSDQNPKYIPHLATYLNGERWLDELDQDPKQNMEGENEYLKGI